MNNARDTLRQVVVLTSALFAIVGAFIGSGAAGGTPIAQAAGGALAADATPIAPGGAAFAIWTPIYIGLLAYAVWQSFPRQKSDQRQRALGYPVAASLVLNGAWILSIQFGLLTLSVPVIAVLLGVLVWAFRLTLASRSRTMVERLVTDVTIGLYLGWVSIATAANVTAWLVQAGFRGFGVPADIWSVVVVSVAATVGILIALGSRGRVSPALSLCWGLGWIAAARLAGGLFSTPTAIAAIVAAALVVAATTFARMRWIARSRAPRMALA